MSVPTWFQAPVRILLRPAATRLKGWLEQRLQPVSDHLAQLGAQIAALQARIATLEAERGQLVERLHKIELEANHVPVLDRALQDVRLKADHVSVLDREFNLRLPLFDDFGRRAAQLESLAARLLQLEDGWRRHMPAVMNAGSTLAAIGHELAALRRSDVAQLKAAAERAERELGELWRHLELVREEALIAAQGTASPTPCGARRAPRILAADKVKAAIDGGLRLHLARAGEPAEGYVNVRPQPAAGADVIAELDDLPFAAASVREIVATEALTYVPQERLRRLLSYWRSLLAPGGTLRAIAPDAEAMLAAVADRSLPFEAFRDALFGARSPGRYHLNLLTPAGLTQVLEQTGFEAVRVAARARKSGALFEFEVVAACPAAAGGEPGA